MRKPLERVTDAFSLCSGDKYTMTAVVEEGRPEIVATLCMHAPCSALGRFDFNGNLHAEWCEGVSVDIVRSAKGCIHREVGVGVSGAKKVQSGFYLGKDCVPQEEREVRVSSCERGEEVIFKSPNCSFGAIGAVHVWSDEFESDLIGLNVTGELSRYFVVRAQFAKSGAVLFEEEEGSSESTYVFFGRSVFHRLDMNVIFMFSEENHDVIITRS